jgi:serpin B
MLCLAMVHEAAAGETRQAMAKALEIAGLNPFYTSLAIAELKLPFRRQGVEVIGANSLWCNDRVQARPEYAAKLRDTYEAELATLDFGSADAVPRINSWVHEKTKGKIGHIVDALSELTAVVAVNAIYFKARWATQFQPEFTRDGRFTTASGQTKQLPMMLQSHRYTYYEDGEMQAVVLPYVGDMAMHIILPAVGTDPRRFQESLSSGAWESRLARSEKVPGFIRMPRFKLDYGTRLEPALRALGMERAFDPKRAEFDGFQTERPIWIDQILHRAVAEVNEQGTVATAATLLATCMSSGNQRLERYFKMIVDRPFFLAIRDETTGTILFMGWVADPE